MNNDTHMLGEAYKAIQEQGISQGISKIIQSNPAVAVNAGAYQAAKQVAKPMVAAAQGAYQGVKPYVAGAAAGVKQLGQNVAGAVTGSQQAPQSPAAAGKQAFSQEQMNTAIDAVMQALGLPVGWRNYVAGQVQGIGNKVNGLESARDQYNVANALRQTAQAVTPQMTKPPRINPYPADKGFSQVKPGSVLGGEVPDSYALQNMDRAADAAQVR